MKGPKILLLASEAKRRAAFAHLLKGLGCMVVTTVSAHEALTALRGPFQPHVILADMEFEGMKFNEFIKTLNQNDEWKKIPLISHTKFLTYKLTDFTKIAASAEQLDERIVDVLRENMQAVPGEILLWVADALDKEQVELPPFFKAAVRFLREVH